MWFVVKGGWPQMILLFLIMRCTPTIRELIEATPLSPSSPSATSLSALAPAQRAGAQRLCALTQMYGPAVRCKRFCRAGVSGLASMYPASDWSMCSGPSWISARMRSHYRTGLNGPFGSPGFACAGKTDPPSSSHPLADSGG